MPNLPSKWLDFVNNKELKRLRADINNTMLIKIQTALSAVFSILSVLLSTLMKDNKDAVIWICIALITLISLLFIVPAIVKWCLKRAEKNIFINGKNATTIFDEEIVYYIMVACEYSKQDILEYKDLSGEVDGFFKLEIEYYVNKALEKLAGFNSNFTAIFGNGEHRISINRLNNIIDLIDKLVEKYSLNISKYNLSYDAIKSKR